MFAPLPAGAGGQLRRFAADWHRYGIVPDPRPSWGLRLA